MYKELKCKEQKLPVTIFFKGKWEEAAASIFRDNEALGTAFYHY
jgi:hypothetical protein